MKNHIDPKVLNQIVLEFPESFTSKEVTKRFRIKGYDFKTNSGELSHHLKSLGYINDGYRSKVWRRKTEEETIKSKTLDQCTDEELAAEFKRRGYTGTLTPPAKSIII